MRFNVKPCHYLLIVAISLLFSCNDNNLRNRKVKKDLKKSWSDQLKEAIRDREIYGAYEPKKGTFILLRRSVGIELSTDNCKTWTWLAKDIFRIDEIFMDFKGTLWGLERWKGIHEPSYCRLHKSVNNGKSWTHYELNTNTFFPYHIYSGSKDTLQIVTFGDNKVYKLNGNDPQHHWTYIKTLPLKDDFTELSIENYFVTRDNDHNKLYKKHIDGKADTLVDFAKAYNIYNIVKANDQIYVSGPANDDRSYFAIIKADKMKKELMIDCGDINLIKTQFNNLFVTGTNGAYLIKNDDTLHVFK